MLIVNNDHKYSIEDLTDGYPRQVMFYDGENYCSGILWGDQLVCGCCGATFWLDEVLEDAREDGVAPIKWFETWVDISDSIGTIEDDGVWVEE